MYHAVDLQTSKNLSSRSRRVFSGGVAAALVLIAGSLAFPILGRPAAGAGSASPARVLANLETSLHEARPGAPLDVIVTFNRPLERLEREALPWQADPGCVRRTFAAARAVACRLSREQIEALVREGVVEQLEADVEVHAMRQAANLAFGVTDARTEFGVSGG
jgi:hypothetical protein